MGRKASSCPKEEVTRGAWTALEDKMLIDYININGEGKWRNIPKLAGLKRCGKSCRLRWLNYLRPGIKRGNITPEEEDLIIRLHKLLGNRWSLIAGRIPGRTDNEIKNYWNTTLGKKVKGDQQQNTFKDKKNKSMVKPSKVPRFNVPQITNKAQIHDSFIEPDVLVNNAANSMDREGGCSNNYSSDFDVTMGDLLMSDYSDDSKIVKDWLSSDYQPILFSSGELVKDWIRDDCYLPLEDV